MNQVLRVKSVDLGCVVCKEMQEIPVTKADRENRANAVETDSLARGVVWEYEDHRDQLATQEDAVTVEFLE